MTFPLTRDSRRLNWNVPSRPGLAAVHHLAFGGSLDALLPVIDGQTIELAIGTKPRLGPSEPKS
jgi:hypothetical protein